MKFIILDEVDYMTKTAQQALKTIINNYDENICFCLICNYISRIEKSLQDIFIQFRFNTLPRDKIYYYLECVINSENLEIEEDCLIRIIDFFEYDIRSMINYLQINQYNLNNISTLDNKTYIKVLHKLKHKSCNVVYKELYDLSIKNNTSTRDIIKRICYMIQNKDIVFKNINNENNENSDTFANIITFVLHDKNNEPEFLLLYLLSKIKHSLI